MYLIEGSWDPFEPFVGDRLAFQEAPVRQRQTSSQDLNSPRSQHRQPAQLRPDGERPGTRRAMELIAPRTEYRLFCANVQTASASLPIPGRISFLNRSGYCEHLALHR